ncbi:hypothetical protein [Streptomyces nigrescens]|uniref:hypothetical protein n=1 Tax=Streptomyces nigrescens TaxID=1920 RepID=UPI00368BDB06
MNRNIKHPGKTYRRKAVPGDHTQNRNGFRITGSWDQRPNRPAIKGTQDRKAVRRIAREMANQGAYVIVEKHLGYDQWRTLYELDGPAQLAERKAAERAAAERAAHARTFALWEEAKAEADRRRRRRLAAEATTHARELMNAPAIVRPENQRRARHVTGAQR